MTTEIPFQAGLRHAPALQHGEEVTISHHDEIIEYIDNSFPVPSLKCDCREADDASANLFRAFAFFIKEVNNDPKVKLKPWGISIFDASGWPNRP